MAAIYEIRNYIDGKLCAPKANQYFEGVNPANGELISKIPRSNDEDVQQAVNAAKKAFATWSKTPAEGRSSILHRIADGIEKRQEELALAESKDNGKPITLAKKVDIPRASSNFRFFGSAISLFASESHDMDGHAINYTLRQSIGVAGCISPWNLPLYLFTWKIAPALASGNCVVAKPSEVTPVTAFLLSEICIEAGLPPGVLNIVHGLGPEVGEAIVKNPEIPAISFTGGTKTGEHIAKIAAPMFKKLSLELGGKNPNLIFADCDFEKMLDTTVRSSFSNQGEICLCGSRIFVEKSIYPKFREAFVEKTKALKVGDPMDTETQMGAIVSEQHMNKILSYIELAKKEGGEVLCGGKRLTMKDGLSKGWFIAPTIIEGLSHDCRTNQEEIFGPVVTLMPFESEEEVLKFANSTRYGLSATIWTNQLNRAHRLASKLQAGIVWINCWLVRDLRTPFGGTKDSGVGREGGLEALRFFTEPKNVCVQLD